LHCINNNLFSYKTDLPFLLKIVKHEIHKTGGKLHREEGPAVVNADRTEEYWLGEKE